MNRKQEISKDLSLVADGLLLGLCLWVSYLLRVSGLIRLDVMPEIPPFSHSYWMLGLIIPMTPLLLDLNRFYDNPLTQRYEVFFQKMAQAGFWLILIIGLSSIFGKLEIPSRSVLILFLLFAPLTLTLRIWVTRLILIHHFKKAGGGEHSVLVGETSDISEFMRELTPGEKIELQISRCFDLNQLDASSITKKIRSHAAERVIFVSPDSPLNQDLPFEFEAEGLEIWLIARNIKGLPGTPSIQSAGNNRALVFRTTSGDFLYQIFKRLLDVIGALVGIFLFLPVGLIIAAIIKITSPGPIIFQQARSGKRGRRFTILKFRSMVKNAPDLHAGLAQMNEMNGPTFKIKRDPRVTPFGEFLRRSSLDEIPQLINVLLGEMSLVGPRPLPDYETDQIEKSRHRRRLSVKPGLTCFWQIRGRNSIRSFEEWVQLDMEYINNASLLLDLWIILQTIPAVLFRKGAQ